MKLVKNIFMVGLLAMLSLASVSCGSMMAKMQDGTLLEISGDSFMGDGFFEISFGEYAFNKHCGVSQAIESFTKPSIVQPGTYPISVSVVDYPEQNIPGKPKYDFGGPFTRRDTKMIGEVTLEKKPYKVTVQIIDPSKPTMKNALNVQINDKNVVGGETKQGPVDYIVTITDETGKTIFKNKPGKS